MCIRDSPNISVTPVLSPSQIGEYTDTVGSTLISIDGQNFFNELKFTLTASGEQKVYLMWQPRWLAIPKDCQWRLLVSHELIDTEGVCD
jgi:hypothetical protein